MPDMSDPSSQYDGAYYDDISRESLRSARELVPMLLAEFNPRSVVDVGCGDGSWLSIFRECGIADTLGFDGDYVDRKSLRIPPDAFVAHDLTQPLVLGRRFDMAMSLEVAEHLPASAASTFVKTLTSLSDRIIFSAAVPGQGGLHHVNEQWPDYWAALFAEVGFIAVDSLRPKIWNSTQVQWWYAQNTIVYEKPNIDAAGAPSSAVAPLPLIHPGMFQKHQKIARSLLTSPRTLIKSFPASMKAAYRRRRGFSDE
jgi:hypothetical protein